MPGPEHLLAGLTDEQCQAVIVEAAPLLVLAGAGSGKTRVLTRRIAWQAATERVDARRVLAVTFTRKAASELRRRLRDLGIHEQVTAGTFHALALSQLRRRWLDLGRRPPRLLERKTRLLGRLVPGSGREVVAALAREIEWAQARLLDPPHYESLARHARRSPPLPPSETASIFEAYRSEKRRRGVVDFDDLLTMCADEIEADAEFAAVIHWRFRHLFVDEFQDLNPAQFRLLDAWLGGRSDLFAVGDDDQAIYGFGGADARYLAEFRAHFGDDATVLRLTANFRSTPQILAVANTVIAPSLGDERRLRATSADGPTPVLTAYDSDADEAAAIARTITGLGTEGVALRDVAVLARTNAQCAFLEQALVAKRVRARVRGAVRFLERPEVESALATVGEGESPEAGVPFPVLLAQAVERAPPPGSGAEAALELLEELGQEYAMQEGDAAAAEGFRDFVAAQVRDDDPTPAADAVEILTFHRAKGLEWPVVFVTGLEEGFVPVAYAVTEAARAEERRLLHVALTRAARRLFLSWARSRTFGGRAVDRAVSPFLAGLDAHLPAGPDVASGGWATEGGRDALREAAARLREASAGAPSMRETADELLGALIAWRERRARAAGVPEAAILDDATLRTISAARPADEATLRELPGVGAVRLARYGPEILELVTGYAP